MRFRSWKSWRHFRFQCDLGMFEPTKTQKVQFSSGESYPSVNLILAALISFSLRSYLESGGKSSIYPANSGKGTVFFRKPLLQVGVESPKLSLQADVVPRLMLKVSSISTIWLTPEKKKVSSIKPSQKENKNQWDGFQFAQGNLLVFLFKR